MGIEKIYSGRVSSKKNGGFYSPNVSFMGISALPTEQSAMLQPLYISLPNPSQFVDKFPKLIVTLQADGTVEDIERDVVFVDANGEQHSAKLVMEQNRTQVAVDVAKDSEEDSIAT